MCLVDPLTHREYTDIAKAQSAACAVDAYLTCDATIASCCHDDDDGLRVSKRPCVIDSRHQHYRCYNCGRYGHMPVLGKMNGRMYPQRMTLIGLMQMGVLRMLQTVSNML